MDVFLIQEFGFFYSVSAKNQSRNPRSVSTV